LAQNWREVMSMTSQTVLLNLKIDLKKVLKGSQIGGKMERFDWLRPCRTSPPDFFPESQLTTATVGTYGRIR